jgi:hypothetical protein
MQASLFPLRQGRLRARLGLGLVALAVLGIWLALASTALATDYTWSGEGLSTAPFWSNGANWLGGVAPAPDSAIGTLTFPNLTDSACSLTPPMAACHASDNDLSGLSVEHLQLPDERGYEISGQGFTLGSGGISGGSAVIAAPIVLSASQTWNVSSLSLLGQLRGESAALTINVSEGGGIGFGAYGHSPTDDEVGNVTITATGQRPYVSLFDNINASDGHSLSINGVEANISASLALGQLSSSHAAITLRGPYDSAVTPTVGGATFDSTTQLDFPIEGSGTQAGKDYSQLQSSGTADLGEANLILARELNGQCSTPPPGSVYTLVSTTGVILGTFFYLPNGSIYTDTCGGEEQNYRINYNTTSSPETVTATAVSSREPVIPINMTPPTITGTPTEGQTLTETSGIWTNSPTSYAEQWQRCDSTGNNCQPIATATAPSYTLTAADVGSTIRVTETASNGEGTGSPASSAATAVVQAATIEPPNNNGGSTTTPTTNNPPVLPPISCCDRPFVLSAAELKALLARQLAPAAGLSLTALLKHGGLALPFTAPEAGTATIQWFEVPAGAQLARKFKAKAVLVASGQASFAAAGPGMVKIRLTAVGKKLLKREKRVRLEARGKFVASSGMTTTALETLKLKQ